MWRDMCVWVGINALTIAIAELHRCAPIIGNVIIALMICTWRLSEQNLSSSLKKAFVLLGCFVWLNRLRISQFATVWRVILFVNVLVMCVPPMYNGRWALACAVLILALKTPEAFDDAFYTAAYIAVFTTYFMFGRALEGYTLLGLNTIVPMAVGLAISNERAWDYRVFGLMVPLIASNVGSRVLFGPSEGVSATFFRPACHRPALFTTLSDSWLAFDTKRPLYVGCMILCYALLIGC